MLGALPWGFSPGAVSKPLYRTRIGIGCYASSSQAVGAGLGDRINERADFLIAEAMSLIRSTAYCPRHARNHPRLAIAHRGTRLVADKSRSLAGWNIH